MRTNSVHNKHKVVGMSSPSNNSVIIIVHCEASSFSNTHTHSRWVLSASAIIQTPTIENNDVSIIVMLQYSDMNRCEIALVIRFCFFSHSPAYALCLFCVAFEECTMAWSEIDMSKSVILYEHILATLVSTLSSSLTHLPFSPLPHIRLYVSTIFFLLSHAVAKWGWKKFHSIFGREKFQFAHENIVNGFMWKWQAHFRW